MHVPKHVTLSFPQLFGIRGGESLPVQIELDTAGKTFQAYTSRYVYPHNESGSSSPHYYSFDIAGTVASRIAVPEALFQNS